MKRSEIRAFSKSELASTAKVLFDERTRLLAASAWRWRRKRAIAATLALAVGLAIGYLAGRFL